MTLDVKVKELAARIEQLTLELATAKSVARRSAFATRVVAFAIALIVGIFLIVNYVHIRMEWTQENLQASLERELNELNPTATLEFSELAQYLVPVYAAETKKQFRKLGPQFSQVFVEQIEGMAAELRRDARDKLRAMDGRIRDQAMLAIAEAYPELMAPPEQERLMRRFEIVTEDALLRALTDFDSRFSNDARELQDDLLSFDLRDTDESTPDLQKKFIRLWLKLLDAEIAKI